jgi:hypothetical protein
MNYPLHSKQKMLNFILSTDLYTVPIGINYP